MISCLDRMDVVLQVSRSIGDFDQKPSANGGKGGLTAEPEISHVILSPGKQNTLQSDLNVVSDPVTAHCPHISQFPPHIDDEYLILGSDGLWDVMSNEEAFALVRDTVKDATLGAKRLVTEALARGEGPPLLKQS